MKYLITSSLYVLSLLFGTLCYGQQQVYGDAIGNTVYHLGQTPSIMEEARHTTPRHPYPHDILMGSHLRRSETTTATQRSNVDPPMIQFDNGIVNWSHLHSDASLPALFDSVGLNNPSANDIYGIFFRDHRVIDGQILTLFTPTIIKGSYVDALDLSTGALRWSRHYGLTNDSRLPTFMSIFPRTDGAIDLSGFHVSRDIPFAVPIGPVSRSVVDLSTGAERDYLYTPALEGGCLCVNPNEQYGRLIQIEEDKTYLASCMYLQASQNTLHWQRTADEQGILIDTIGVVDNLLDEFYTHKYIDAYKLPNGYIAVGVQSYFFPTVFDRFVNEILLLDPQGALVRRVDITAALSYASFFDMKMIGDRLYISSRSLNEDKTAYSKGNYVVMNQEGDLLTSISDFDVLDGEPVSWVTGTYLDEEHTLLIGRDLDANAHCLKLFRVSLSGEVEHLQNLCHADTSWRLRPEFAQVVDDALVLQVTWEWLDGGDQFMSTMSLPLDQFGLSSTEYIAFSDAPLLLQPNPTSTTTRLVLPHTHVGWLQVIDASGRSVHRQRIEDASEILLDVSEWGAGTYIVQVTNDQQGKRVVRKLMVK